jgi:tetratricopeptide (TPR) repeat protein
MIYRPRRLVHGLLLVALALAAHGFADDQGKDKEPSKDFEIEQLQTTYQYQNDGTGSVTQSSRIRVLTEAGRDAIGQFYFSYSSSLEDLRIGYFRTVKKDGTQLPVDPAQAVDTASPISQAAPMFSDVKIKVMVARDLAVGDALEYEYTRVVRVPLKAGDFWAMHYQNQSSVVDSEVVMLDVPADRHLALKASPDPHSTVEKDGRRIYRWELSNPKPREASDLPADPVFVASTLTDWKQVGDWYRGLEAGRVEVTPEIKALAAQLTTGKNTPREKLDALYAYASEQVRYVALEFGIGGYQPHAAADVLKNRYGDCKDKSGLLEALLAAAGIGAYPALLNAERGVIEPAVPMPGQFDHVITVVPMDGRLLWMDPTLGVAPLGVLAATERGKQALLVEPGASRLADIPDTSPVPERESLTATGKLDATGKLTLDDQLELQGAGEIILRTLFRLGNQDAINMLAKHLAEMQADGATTADPKPSDPLDLSKPFRLDLTLTDADFFPALEKTHDVRAPLLATETAGLAIEIERARKQVEEAAKKPGGKKPQDIDLEPGGTVDYGIDVEIDPAYQVDLPLPVHVDRSFASYDSTYTFDKGHLRAGRTLTLKMTKLPAADWQDLEAFRKLIDSDSAQTLQLRRASALSLESKTSDLSAEDAEQQGIKALEHGDPYAAEKLFRQATKKDPESKTAWNNLGRAEMALGLLDPAEAALRTEIKVHPDDEYAYNNLGRIYAARHEYDRAIEQYRKQLEINPLDPYTYPNLAAAYEAMNRWDDAAEAWSKQVAIDHTQWSSYAAWGYALFKAGKLDDGRDKMKRALDMDRSPMTLNDVAYQMAEAGVDLDQAAQYARSAVEQAVASVSDADSLDVPKDYNARLMSLSAFLDTLGWVYFRQKQFSQAEPLIAAAHDLHAQSDIAEHLARVFAGENRPDDALRFYAWSMAEPGWTGRSAPELKQYLETHFGGPEGLMHKAAEVDKGYFGQHRLAPPAPSAWPQGAGPGKSAVVQLQALVDEKGAVRDVQATAGDEPFRSAALQDARTLTLPVFNATGLAVKTVRSITYVYSASHQVTALWDFGKSDEHTLQMFNASQGSVFAPGMMLISSGQMDQGIASLREALRTQPDSPYAEQAHMAIAEALSGKRDYQGAATEYRAAAQSSPDDPRPRRLLGDTLSLAGDHAAALVEYQRAVDLNPSDADAHFTLGAQLEAAAATEALKGVHYDARSGHPAPASSKLSKSALDNYRAACEQYRLAHQLVPDMPDYAEAYERLAKQLGKSP